MSQKSHSFFHQYDFILDKPLKKLELLEEKPDDGGSDVPMAVDSFLSNVIEAYGMVGEMTSADKQQVSTRLAAVKEKSVQCNNERVGGSFDGGKWRCISRSVMETLTQTVEEARRAQMLRQLQLCDNNLNGILKTKFMDMIITEYKRLLSNTARLLEYVYKYISWGTLKGQQNQNLLLLCASQLQKLFPLLLHAVEVSDKATGHCLDLKEYFVQRMKVCLLKMKNVIEGKISEEGDNGDDLGGGLFITHMDQALSYLAVFNSISDPTALCAQWRESVEAVLQHAMSIAQIASEFDFKRIHASGEKILRECENLDKEYKSTNRNPSVCKLHATSLSNALEELEQRVCASVLKMYLQVFSNPFAPLQNLCIQCLSTQVSGEERHAEDLSDAIFAFDTHTDRILQVAVFAIACSEDQNRVLGIRSCLASLESLEAHLVPALSTLYLKQAPKQHIFEKMLVEHWSSEVNLLWQLIDGIVDPAALAQISHNEISVPTAVLKKSILANKALNKNELHNIMQSIVSYAGVLSHQLEGSAADLKLSLHPPVQEAFNDLLQAVKEGKAALQKIKTSMLSVDRILKRCELLVSCVGKIQPLLEDLDNPEANQSSSQMPECASLSPVAREEVAKKESSKKLKSLKKHLISLGLPSDADIDIDTTDATGVHDTMLSFMNKTAAHPRFTTSFLYNDQEKKQKHIVGTPRSFPSNNTFSRKGIKHQHNQLLQQTLSLDVSKLVGLSETLRCQNNSIIESNLSHKLSVIDSEPGENSSKNITTPERMKDLAQVQNKIDAVKLSSQSFFSDSAMYM